MEKTHNNSSHFIRRFLVATLLGMTLIGIPGTSFAYNSNICKSTSGCTQAEVGPFMQGISQGCGNLGDCTLSDILLVFVNVGNYVVGIIGGVVLLMYVVGGFYWLASAGRKEWVDKGKKYMTISTAGLLIVMFSSLAIYALKGALRYGSVQVDGEYVACTGTADTEGDACDLNSTCVEGLCLSLCEQEHPEVTYDTTTGIQSTYYCVDRDTEATSQASSTSGYWYTESTCVKNKCYGDSNTQCCLRSHVQRSDL